MVLSFGVVIPLCVCKDFVHSPGPPQKPTSALPGSSDRQHTTSAGKALLRHKNKTKTFLLFSAVFRHPLNFVSQELTWSHTHISNSVRSSSSNESVWPEMLLQFNIEQVHFAPSVRQTAECLVYMLRNPQGLKTLSLLAVWQGAGEFPVPGTTDLYVPGPPGGTWKRESRWTCRAPHSCQWGLFMPGLSTDFPKSPQWTSKWCFTEAPQFDFFIHVRFLSGCRHRHRPSSLFVWEVSTTVFLHYRALA